ncbi:MAG TPA: hypothetical protein VH951_08245 [Dehalococcoidia bacterium]|jgi:hypothetical protein
MAGAAAIERMIGEDTLRRIDPKLVAVRKEFVKRVTAFFTDGKGHPSWASAGVDANEGPIEGAVVRVINTGQDMELRGTLAVDVAVTAGPQLSLELWGGRGMQSRNVTQKFRIARRKTCEVLVHELRHVVVCWTAGLVPGTRRNLEEVQYQAAFQRDGYANAFEKDAFAYASAWMAQNRARVDAGDFDDVLPVEMISRYAPS